MVVDTAREPHARRGEIAHPRATPLIVIVDDDESVLHAVEDVLSGAGYLVEAAADWRQGYKLVQERQPDLVVADLMFDGDPKGWQLLQVLRTGKHTRAIPLIVISAHLNVLNRHGGRLVAMGIGVVPKPFTPQQLLDAIAPALDSSVPEEGAAER